VLRVLLVKRFEPGVRVRLTGAFLRNTGQMAGGEGLSRWHVRACDCDPCTDGRMVAVDEKWSSLSLHWTPEEIAADPRLQWRHINTANLERAPQR
jgi:hypothetical protein